MVKVSSEYMQAKRDQIARAAIEQFSRRGIHLTSMANIIEASELSAGTIYIHFKGKNEIIAYVARTTFSGLFAEVEAAVTTEPPPRPSELIDLITSRIATADIPSGLLIQVWGEAVSNQEVRRAANSVYEQALDTLREYCVAWMLSGEGKDLPTARREAPARAHLMVSLIYAQILQMSLIDGYDTGSLSVELATLLDRF